MLLEFYTTENQLFYLKADLKQGSGILSFPNHFHRTKSNSVDLFGEVIGLTISTIRQTQNDRSFFIEFEDGHIICVKMYGARSNLILAKNGNIITVFNQNLKKDFTAPIPEDQTFEIATSPSFHWPEIKLQFPTFDKWMWKWVENCLAKPSHDSVGQIISEMVETMEKGPFLICRMENEVILSFFPLGETLETIENPIEAANRYYHYFWQVTQLLRSKARVRENLERNRQFVWEQLAQTKKQILKLDGPSPYRIQADLLMAYSYQIPQGQEKVQLPDFETGKPIEIRLKKEMSIAENAERLYKKAKGAQLEKAELKRKLDQWETRMAAIEMEKNQLEKVSTFKDLKPFNELSGKTTRKDEDSQPFHSHWFQGFEIRVGKNAKANDELLKLSRKDDFWLHARDTQGSHVIIPVSKNTHVPNLVKERAAELAAYYSKARNDSLCPVMITERKYVRKNKSMAAGQVRVEREKTILVKPKG